MLASRPAVGADAETTAIASFLSIGLANAPGNFQALLGAQIRSNAFGANYVATQWPDHTHFAKCVAFSLRTDPASASYDWSYACTSTPRDEPGEALFKMAEAAVQANLPAGYISSGVQRAYNGAPYENWKRPGSPQLSLQLMTAKDGTSYYVLSI